MEAFHRIATAGDGLERRFKLGEVTDFDGDMPVAHATQPEAELGAGDAPRRDQIAVTQMPKIAIEAFDKCEVGDPGLEVAKHVINIHPASAPAPMWPGGSWPAGKAEGAAAAQHGKSERQ